MDEFYCALCGGPFNEQKRSRAGPDDLDREAVPHVGSEVYGYYDGTKVSRENMRWLRCLRVITPYDDEPEDEQEYPDGIAVQDGYWISGIGFGCLYNEAHVPYLYDEVLPRNHEEEEKKTVLTVYGERDDSRLTREWWSYPFHDACLQILRATLVYKEAKAGIPRIPWNVIHHVFGLHCDADIGIDSGLRLDYEHTANLQYWEIEPGDEKYVVDPVNVHGLHNLLSNPPPFTRASSPSAFTSTSPKPADPFSHLPVELILHLTTYLPSTAYVALYLASRVIASLRLASLQSFWRTRVAWMPFVLESDLRHLGSGTGNWREVCMMLSGESEGILDECLGWKNRRRIWKVCMELVEEVAMLAEDCAGDEEVEEVDEEDEGRGFEDKKGDDEGDA